jgi:hypothetical protein
MKITAFSILSTAAVGVGGYMYLKYQDNNKNSKSVYKVKPPKKQWFYCIDLAIYTPSDFQMYINDSIRKFDNSLVLKAIELKPSNFALLNPLQMTCSVMHRAFELEVENIKYLAKLKEDYRCEDTSIFVKKALEHAVMVHGYEKVADVVNSAPVSFFKKVWNDIKK